MNYPFLSFIDSIVGGIVSVIMSALKPVLFDAIVKPILDALANYLWKDIYLDLIFKPFVTITYETFVDNPINVFEFSYVALLTNRFKAVAWGMFILILMFQSLKSMFAYLGFETEEAWKIGAKALFFGVLIAYADQLCTIIIQIFMGDHLNIGFKDAILNGQKFGEAIGELSDSFRTENLLSLNGIICLYLSFKLMSLSFRFAERFAISAFLTIVSPVAFACGPSKPTKGYLAGWVKAFSGNLFVQLLQITGVMSLLYFRMNDYDKFGTSITSGSVDIGQYHIGSWNGIIPLIFMVSIIKAIEKVEEMAKRAFVGVGISGAGPLGGISEGLSKLSAPIFPMNQIRSVINNGSPNATRHINPSLVNRK